MNFQLDYHQNIKFKNWQKIQDKKVCELQKNKFPYYGVTGGGYLFMFIPTSIGIIIKIQNNITKEEIDITDYNAW